MAYDEDLAGRVRVSAEVAVAERPMFGGFAFLVDGRMAVAVSGRGGLMVRADPSQVARLSAQPHTQPFEMRGVEMKSWLRVGGEGLRTKRQLDMSPGSPVGSRTPAPCHRRAEVTHQSHRCLRAQAEPPAGRRLGGRTEHLFVPLAHSSCGTAGVVVLTDGCQ